MFQTYLECVLSYGENCQHPCNELCINQTCDKINGSCLYGCKKGEKCYESINIWFRYVIDIHFLYLNCILIASRFLIILDLLYHTNVFDELYRYYTVFLDVSKNAKLSPSDNLPVIVGGTLGACVIVLIGVVLILFVIRYASYSQIGFNMDICLP